MDYHLTWYKCCPYWDDVQWPWPASIPQRSRSHKTFKGQSTHASVTCSYIQEYLGYQSNNLYFLFSHSWPVVVYTFCQVQRTSQVERKTKCSKNNNDGGYSRPLDCLVFTVFVRSTTNHKCSQLFIYIYVLRLFVMFGGHVYIARPVILCSQFSMQIVIQMLYRQLIMMLKVYVLSRFNNVV